MSASKRSRYGDGSVSPKGRHWQGRFYVDGKQVKRSLGLRREVDPEGLTEMQARKKLREIQANFKPVPAGGKRPFREVNQEFIRRKAALGLSEATVSSYQGCLEHWFGPAFGDVPFAEVTHAHVDRLQQKMLLTLEPSTVKVYITKLSSVFAFGVKQKLRDDNPCDAVEKPKVAKGEELRILFSAQQAEVFAEIPDDEIGKVERVLYPFCAKTGLRQGEATARLRWRHLDFAGRNIQVLGKTKSRKSRAVPMASDVKIMLEQWRKESLWNRDDDLVFAHPGTGRPMGNSTVLARFQKAVLRADVGAFRYNVHREGKVWEKWPKTTFHDLRHCFGTACAMAGVPLRKLQRWLGHENITTTMIYVHYYPSEDEAEVLDRAFGNPVGESPSEELSPQQAPAPQQEPPDIASQAA